MNRKKILSGLTLAAVLLTAFVLAQPTMNRVYAVGAEGIQDLEGCTLRPIQPEDPISMNTVKSGNIAKTIHAEKEIFDCKIEQGNIRVIVDLTTVAEIYEDLSAKSIIKKQVEVITCVKEGSGASVLGCTVSAPATSTVPVINCHENLIAHPQEMNTINKGSIVKTIVAQKEVFRCLLNISFLFKFGSSGTGDGQFNSPQGVTTDSSDRIIVADAVNNRIQVFDSSGMFLFKFGSPGTGDGQFDRPVGVATDSSDRIIVADRQNDRIQVFDSSGMFLFKFGSSGTGDGQFNTPRGVTTDSSDRIIVADTFNNRIQVFDSSGMFLFKFGSSGTGDGQFDGPSGVTTDSSDRIIVADRENDRIQVFDQTNKKVDTVLFTEIWENLSLLPDNPIIKRTFESLRCIIQINEALVESCKFSTISD